jgi:putative protease
MHFLGRSDRPELHGDFSLNVTNSITAHHLLNLGLSTVTASHDLDQNQLFRMLDALDPARVAVTIHHHIPTFHTEHCVYSHLLSNGRDYRTCGRPCEKHEVSLRDRVDLEHPVIVDVGCRNTVFNAQAQSAAFLVPRLAEMGVSRLRVEFVRESFEEARLTLQAYQALLDGEISHQELVAQIGVHEQFGVTRGTMEVISS